MRNLKKLGWKICQSFIICHSFFYPRHSPSISPSLFSFPHSLGYFGLLDIIAVRLFYPLQVNLKLWGSGYLLIVKGAVILFSSRITWLFYSWWKLSVVFHWADSVLHGTHGQLSCLKLGIGNYTLQVFLPNPKMEINFLVFSTDAGSACVAVSYVN